jgi:hypothetical protein
LADIRAELENLASRLSSDRLRKMNHQLFRREHIARSYQIFLRNYRANYPIVPEVEAHMLRSDSVGALAKYLKRIYDYIRIMEKGRDIE